MYWQAPLLIELRVRRRIPPVAVESTISKACDLGKEVAKAMPKSKEPTTHNHMASTRIRQQLCVWACVWAWRIAICTYKRCHTIEHDGSSLSQKMYTGMVCTCWMTGSTSSMSMRAAGEVGWNCTVALAPLERTNDVQHDEAADTSAELSQSIEIAGYDERVSRGSKQQPFAHARWRTES